MSSTLGDICGSKSDRSKYFRTFSKYFELIWIIKFGVSKNHSECSPITNKLSDMTLFFVPTNFPFELHVFSQHLQSPLALR